MPYEGTAWGRHPHLASTEQVPVPCCTPSQTQTFWNGHTSFCKCGIGCHHPLRGTCKGSCEDSWYLQSRNGTFSVSGEALWELPAAPIPSIELACHVIRSLSKSESLIVLLQGESNSYNDIALRKSSQAQYIMLKQSIASILDLAVSSEEKTVYLHRSWSAKENFNYLVL